MVTKDYFDSYQGNNVYVFTITDKISVRVCTLGATVLSVLVPDKSGEKLDVCLGMCNANDIITKGDYMGAVVGRVGNRIANGRFCLDGKVYQLACNNGKAHLHGGNVGFNQKVFSVITTTQNSVTMALHSADGEEGYPSDLDMTVTYTVEGSSFTIDYTGTTTGKTIFSPTNHSYFNLNGEFDGSVLDNVLQINADSYLAVDTSLIPVCQQSVAGTAFDFRFPKQIGCDIDEQDEQLLIAGGYDHNYCVNDSHVATAYSVKSGVQMDVYSDRPGVQFYTGNFLCGNVGKSKYNKRSGFCLETQCYPDAINHANYPSCVLSKGEKFTSYTKYVFSVKHV